MVDYVPMVWIAPVQQCVAAPAYKGLTILTDTELASIYSDEAPHPSPHTLDRAMDQHQIHRLSTQTNQNVPLIIIRRTIPNARQ